MVINIANYTVKTIDDFNFQLTIKRKKKAMNGKNVDDGDTEAFVGYYGSLKAAFEKILNHSVLTDDDITTIQGLTKKIDYMEEMFNEEILKLRPKHHVLS